LQAFDPLDGPDNEGIGGASQAALEALEQIQFVRVKVGLVLT